MKGLIGFLTLVSPALALAGTVGGYVSLDPADVQGNFHLSSSSCEAGVLGEVLKYYRAAGAVQSVDRISVVYGFPNQANDNGFFQQKGVDPGDVSYYRLSWLVNYKDLMALSGGDGARVQFRGVLAADLYDGMPKAGVKSGGSWFKKNGSGNPLDPSAIAGQIYQGSHVICEKTDDGPDCIFVFPSKSEPQPCMPAAEPSFGG